MSSNKNWLAVLALVFTASSAFAAKPIVGGTAVSDQKKVPFLVQLFDRNGVECGGSVIAPTWILSAGHCGDVVSGVTVYGGSLTQGQGTKLKVKAHYIHPQFNESNTGVSYDFMLIQLSTPIDFSTGKIQAIDLATTDFANRGLQDAGQVMTVAGWGDLRENGGDYPTNAYSVDVPIVSQQDANASNAYDGAIDDSSIAAGFPNGGKDSCDGDSGGPLYRLDPTTNKNVLVGVVSFGEGCARAHKYGIYSRVTAGYDWIKQTMAAHPATPVRATPVRH